jgi:hypothetical protein
MAGHVIGWRHLMQLGGPTTRVASAVERLQYQPRLKVTATTPRPLIDSVVRSVCGREVERVVRLTGGGMNETYRVELPNDVVVVRIAPQPVPCSPTRSTSWPSPWCWRADAGGAWRRACGSRRRAAVVLDPATRAGRLSSASSTGSAPARRRRRSASPCGRCPPAAPCRTLSRALTGRPIRAISGRRSKPLPIECIASELARGSKS